MPPHPSRGRSIGQKRAPTGPTQRQLRAGELVRHALVDIIRHDPFSDPVLDGVSVTISEVRVSPDLKHALCFIQPLGGQSADEVIAALNRATRLLRGELGRAIDMKFTPELKFVPDDTFDNAARIDRLLSDPRVRRDVERVDDEDEA